jgi:hypothetical protein
MGASQFYRIYSRSPMEVGRRKKEEAVRAMVSAIKNVLTVLAVAIFAKMGCSRPNWLKVDWERTEALTTNPYSYCL